MKRATEASAWTAERRASAMRRAACGLFLFLLVGPPARAWDADTHYDLVYYVALELGYTDAQAHRIASGSIAVDLDPDIEPLQVSGVVNPWGDAQTPRVLFHAFADSRLYDKLIEAGNGKRDASDACIEARDKRTKAFYRQVVGTGNPGAYIHFFQDVYDHGRYWSWQGHMTDGHAPDFLSWKLDDSKAMLKGLVAELTRYHHLCFAREPAPPAWDRLNAVLDELIRANPADTWGNTFFTYNMMGRGVPDEDAGRDVVEKALNRVLPDWLTYDLDMHGECASPTWKLADWVAPSGVLRVKVLNQATGDPVDGAKVELRFPGSRDIQRSGTALKGICDFASTPGETGTYALEATADGYAPGAAEATVEAGAEFPAVAVIRLTPGVAPPGVATFHLKAGFPKLRTASSVDETGAILAGGRWEYDETTGSGDKLHYLLEVTGSSATSVSVHYVCTRGDQKHERTYTSRWDTPWPATLVPGQTRHETTVTGEATGTGRVERPVNASTAWCYVGVNAANSGIEGAPDNGMVHLGDTDTAMWDPEPRFVTTGSNPYVYTFTADAARNESVKCSAGMRLDIRANHRFANDQKFINWGIWMEWEYERVGAAPDQPASPPAQAQPSAVEAPPTAGVTPAVEASKPPAGPPIRVTACGGGTTASIDWEQPTELSEGSDLPSGRLVEVRASGVRLTTIRLPGGALVSMTPGSRVQITPSGEVNLFEGAVDVDTGGARGAPPVEVRTPNAAVTDEGTVFHVGFDARAAKTEVRVDEGRVAVEQPLQDGSRPRTLAPGESCTVEGAEPDSRTGDTEANEGTPTGRGGNGGTPPSGRSGLEGWADPPPRDWASAALFVCERYTPTRPLGVGTEFRAVRSLTGYAPIEDVPEGEVVELLWFHEDEEVARSSAVAQQRTRLFCSVFRGDDGREIEPGRYELRMVVAGDRVASVRFVVLP